jgi:hypothetical protein
MVAVGRRASLTQAELCREPTEVPVGLLVEIGPLKLHIEKRHDRRVAQRESGVAWYPGKASDWRYACGSSSS